MRFVLLTRQKNWGEDRVMYYDEMGRLRSLLTSWTDVADQDHFTLASAGKSWFRIDDLLRLCSLIRELKEGHGVR
jgi:lipopolysaccharide biosynthesis protein